MTRGVAVSEAWRVLGIAPGSTEDQAKAAYRRLALTSHPDKVTHRDEASVKDATARFQEVSAAWETLQTHYKPPPLPSFGGAGRGGPGYAFHAGGGQYFYSGGGNPYTSYDDEDDDYDYESSEGSDEGFFNFMFENVFNHGGYSYRGDYYQQRRQQARPEQRRETAAAQAARMRRQREERVAADQRRAEEERLRRVRREEEAQQEAGKAAERRKAKSAKKQAARQATAQETAMRAQEARLKSQVLRSSAFSAARKGLAAMVREAVWEENVQASDGEWLAGVEVPKSATEDPKETLLHIAASHGDKDLVQWLVDHGAVPEERDSKDCTFFHRALVKGGIALISHLLTTYPVDDEENDAVVRPPAGETLLSLVVSSTKSDAVRLLLPHSSIEHVSECWAWLDSVPSDPSIRALLGVLATKPGFDAPAPSAAASPAPTPVAPQPMRMSAEPATLPKKNRKKAKGPRVAADPVDPAPPPFAPAPPTKGPNKRPPTSSAPSSSQSSPAASIKLDSGSMPAKQQSAQTTAPKGKAGPPRRRKKAPAQQPATII